MTPPNFPQFEPDSPYRRLARSLDALPNGFPPAKDESDLRLLAKIFTPEEAALAAELRPELETVAQIAARLGSETQAITPLLKEMSKKGLITLGKTAEGRLGFGLMPFVVGIYEEQISRIDAELAELFECYYHQAFGRALEIQPQVHRVIPVRQSVKNTMEVLPCESVTGLIDGAQAWGVLDCICRTQKALIGDPCEHPIDVCMVLGNKPDVFANSTTVRALSHTQALETLQRASAAGLVHCVSNNQRDTWYICNCCTCSCAILRGMAEMGIANVVARSAFVNRVDEDACLGCGECVEACQFDALTLDGAVVQVDGVRCAGCGVCVPVCPQDALGLERREGENAPPLGEAEWAAERNLNRKGVK
jgi:electron transport complex protein RnfB